MKSKVLIIGAGPAGLAIAACLKKLGIDFYQVGKVAGAYAKMYPHLTISSPTRYNSLPYMPLQTDQEYISAKKYANYLQQYALYQKLQIDDKKVTKVEPGFKVHFDAGDFCHYSIVIVATGMFDYPHWPDIKGIYPKEDTPQIFHACHWPGPDNFKDKKLLIVGGAATAIEIAEECVQKNIAICLSARKIRLSPQKILGRDIHDYGIVIEKLIPKWLAKSFCQSPPTIPAADLGFKAFWRQGKIKVYSGISHLEGQKVFFKKDKAINIDAICMATGYEFKMPFLPQEISRTKRGHPLANKGESIDWPGLFFIGIPCSRKINSEFLRGIAADAPILAREIANRCK